MTQNQAFSAGHMRGDVEFLLALDAFIEYSIRSLLDLLKHLLESVAAFES